MYETLSPSLYGFRIEGKSYAKAFAETPFYFRRSTDFDDFNKKPEIVVPPGQLAAGVWLFNTIDALTSESVKLILGREGFITRINLRSLSGIVFVEDNHFRQGHAGIAIKYYEPTVEQNLSSEQFVKNLTVPDELIEFWSGEQWIRKSETGLFDLDRVLELGTRGKYLPPDHNQSVMAIGNEPHVTQPVPENWWRPANSLPTLPPLTETAERLARLFRIAQNKSTLRELRREQHQLAITSEWHLQQSQIFKKMGDLDGERLHLAFHDARDQDTRRLQHERIEIMTGQSFWEVHDIGLWAHKIMQLERVGDPNKLWNELPASAVPDLHRKVKKLHHSALRERYKKPLDF